MPCLCLAVGLVGLSAVLRQFWAMRVQRNYRGEILLVMGNNDDVDTWAIVT